METQPIIPQLDVPGNILFRLLPRRVNGTVDSFDFYCGVERLGESIVEAYPGAANGLPDPQTLEDGGEVRRGVIAPPVGVKPKSA